MESQPLSALFRPSPVNRSRENTELSVLKKWELDDSLEGVEDVVMKGFDAVKGVFTCMRDGLYSIVVQIIPIDGGANVSNALRRRKQVAYCVQVEEPNTEKTEEGSEEETRYYDVGPTTLGELMHLKAGSKLSIYSLPGSFPRESVRVTIDLVQRKRKRAPEPELTKKQLKKLRKRRRSEDEEEGESGSEWSFSSDDSE